ncbi:MAG: hypothetical protein QY311_00760 [Candidatus Paceibacterota bacterium]|nr:MAG: hypothetical protein QY311_00760 [Candidatus Paceibacterota bacterium]
MRQGGTVANRAQQERHVENVAITLGISAMEVRQALNLIHADDVRLCERSDKALTIAHSCDGLRTIIARAVEEVGPEHPLVEHILEWWLANRAKTYEELGVIFRNAPTSSPVRQLALERLMKIGMVKAKNAASFEAVWNLLEYAPTAGHLTETIVQHAIQIATRERNLQHLNTVWGMLERFYNGHELQATCLKNIEDVARFELRETMRMERLVQIFKLLPWQTAARVDALRRIVDNWS